MNPAADTTQDVATENGVSADVLALLDQHDAAQPPPEGDAAERPASAPPAAGGEPATPPAAAGATPDLKPFEERFAQLQAEKTKLAEREAAIAARERLLPSAEAFKADAIGELRRLAAQVVGSDDDAKIAAFLSDEIYEPLMVEVLAMKDPDKLDPGIKNRAEIRRLNRILEAEKRAREAHQQELAAEKQRAEETTKLTQVKETLARWIEGKGSDYPHLKKYSANPAEDVFEIMLGDEKLTPENAARLAEEHYARERKRYSDQVPSGNTTTAAGSQATNKSGQSATRATSLTNSGATEGTATAGDSPPTDPEASAEYWASRLERDPESVAALVKRRR